MARRFKVVVGGDNQKAFGWSILPAPYALGIIEAGVAVTYDLTQYATLPAGVLPVWRVASAPAGVTINQSGVLSIDEFVPPASLYTAKISLSQNVDGYAETQQSFTFEVVSLNSDPVWANNTPTSITLITGFSYNFGQYASDPDGDTLTFSLVNPPPNYDIDPVTGALTVRKSIVVTVADLAMIGQTIGLSTGSAEYPNVKISTFHNATVGAYAHVADDPNWNPLADADNSYGLTVASTPVRSANSNRSLSVYVNQSNPAAKERAEIRWGNPSLIPATTGTVNGVSGIVIATQDVWFGWSTFVPSTWKRLIQVGGADAGDDVEPIIQQWHHFKEATATENNPWATVNIGASGGVPSWLIVARRNRTRPALNENTCQYSTVRPTLRLGEWTDWVVRVRLHPDAGYFVAWKKDSGTAGVFSKVFDSRGRAAYNGANVLNADGLNGTGLGFAAPTNTTHFKSGIYVPLWDNDTLPNTTVDINGNPLTTVQIYHAQYRAYFGNLASEELGIEYVRPR